MQVRADRVGQEPLRDGRRRHRPQKAAPAVADIKQHPALTRGQHPGLDLSGQAVDQLDLAVVVTCACGCPPGRKCSSSSSREVRPELLKI